jgi:hypothetical protein
MHCLSYKSLHTTLIQFNTAVLEQNGFLLSGFYSKTRHGRY